MVALFPVHVRLGCHVHRDDLGSEVARDPERVLQRSMRNNRGRVRDPARLIPPRWKGSLRVPPCVPSMRETPSKSGDEDQGSQPLLDSSTCRRHSTVEGRSCNDIVGSRSFFTWEEGIDGAGHKMKTHMEDGHDRLQELGLTPSLKREFEPFPDDVQGVVVVDPGTKVVVAGVVPDLGQYFETRRGLNF